MRCSCSIPSPIGPLTLTSEGNRLVGIEFDRRPWSGLGEVVVDHSQSSPIIPVSLKRAVEQLGEYFSGTRHSFELGMGDLDGTDFQRQVWGELLEIPYGTTISYGDLASRIGRPKAVRAVGGCVGRNPIAIVIPCHRVIGANRSLTGFGGGLERKQFLLDLECPFGAEQGTMRNASRQRT